MISVVSDLKSLIENLGADWLTLLIGLVAALVLVLWLGSYGKGRKTRRAARQQRMHQRKVALSKLKLRDLKRIGDEKGIQSQFGFLRSNAVEPFVFEEMILTALADRGISIKRNERYTGDNGIDGKAKIGGKEFYIQAKLYSNHISRAHVDDFIRLCEDHHVCGLFVHTGRTGAGTMQLGHGSGLVDIVSGERMIKLLTGRRVAIKASGITTELPPA